MKFINKYNRIIKALILALIPITTCLFRCLVAKRSFGDVWFLGSAWNDEVFYWQLTNDVIHYGIPQGHFGFNESSARMLTFSAWSPLLLIFWVIYGLIFGWTFLSPIICNIIVLSMALFIFAILVRPSFLQTGLLAVLLFMFKPLSRYLMSCMPEITVMSLLIVFLGITVAFYKEYKRKYLIASLILIFVMTLMRPYLVMFSLFTIVITFINRKGRPAPIVTAVVSVILFFLENYYFGVEYLDSYLNTEWIDFFIRKGGRNGLAHLKDMLLEYGGEIFGRVMPGIISGKDGADAYYGAFVFLAVIFLILSVMSVIRKQSSVVLFLPMFLMYVGMFFAIIYLYKVAEGSRHVILFVVAGALLLTVTLERIESFLTYAAVFILFSWVFVYHGNNAYYYGVCFKDSTVQLVEDSSEMFSTSLELKDGVSWDNTVIWVLVDYIDETGYAEPMWRRFYGLPAGYALNICRAEFVCEGLDNLSSRYLVTVPQGSVDKLLSQKGYSVLAERDDFILYDLRDKENNGAIDTDG